MVGLNGKIKKEGGRWLGFSLIELMITISIMGILTATMIPALRSFDRKNKLGAASEQLKGAITEARNYSLAPRFGDKNAKIYAVRIKDLSKNEYSIGFWDVDQDGADALRAATLPVTSETTWESHWTSISDRKYPLGVRIEVPAVDACPNLIVGNGPGKPGEFSIGFTVPEGSPIFDTMYNFSNKTSEGTCGLAAIGWTATDNISYPVAGAGLIKITSSDDSTDFKTIFIHSYNGKITVKDK